MTQVTDAKDCNFALKFSRMVFSASSCAFPDDNFLTWRFLNNFFHTQTLGWATACSAPPLPFARSVQPPRTSSLIGCCGALFNSEASCDEEVKSRLAIARQRLGELVPIWKSRTVSNKLKARLINALVRPIVTAEINKINK